jgi:RNA polymerase sigma-70 factor, ECF subfamily
MAKTHLTDTELVNRYISGDENALSLLITRHQSRIYGFIYSKVNDRDLADDFFQETFIKVINKIKMNGTYIEKGKFLPWVMRIAHNLIIDEFRKNKKVVFLRDNDEYSIFSIIKSEDIAVEVNMINEEEHLYSTLSKLLEMLPKDQKEMVIMRLYNNKSFKEIAEEKGISVNTALGRMRYAISNMKKNMKKNNIILSA